MKHTKKALSVLLTLVMLICLIPAGILAAEGNTATIGNDSYEFTVDAEGNYLIQSEADWNALSDAVCANELCQGLTFKQTADLSVTRPIGKADSKTAKKFFCGTYDGGNHTLTVSLNSSDAAFKNNEGKYCCPFPYVSGVTIKNLRVEGTITTEKKFASGLLGQLLDGGTVSNVEVAVTLTSQINGDGTHGGVIAVVDSKILVDDGNGYVKESSSEGYRDLVTNITNVTFCGSLLGDKTHSCGGFVGYAKSVVNFKECVFNPVEVHLKVNQGNGPSFTYARDAGGTETYEGCIYTAHLEKTDPTYEGAVEASTTPPTDGSDYVAVVVNGVTYYKEASTDPEFSGYSLILTGTVGMTFYVHIPDSTEWTKEDSYMTFAISGKGGLVSDRANFDANNMTNPGNTTFYGFTCNVTALQMADKITATYHVMNGSTEVKTITNTCSVEDYIKVIVKGGNSTYGERTVELAKALADYGHYVQLYLSDLRGFTLAADNDNAYAPMNTYYDAFSVSDAKSAVENYGIVRGINDDIQKITFSMLFESDNSICVYVFPKASFEGTVSATVDGNPCTVTKVNSSKYQIKISSLNATQFATSHTVVISTGNGDDVTVTVSAFSYLREFFNKYADGTTASNAAAAAYNYYAEACRLANAH
ncbi:MAG: hypothetical protein J6U36_00220 [Oscillospiraceae bacterium]|nr:hypothetical protein [Oscillospiraceae bacterium]